MMLDINTIIRPELLPVIIASIYLLCLIPLKKLNFTSITLSILTLSTLAPVNNAFYSYMIALVYIFQAFMFMNEHSNKTAYKFFFLALASICVNLSPIIPYYDLYFLTLGVLYVLSMSENEEINNTYIYTSNIIILSGLVLRISAVSNHSIVAIVIIAAMILASLRLILNGITSILYLMPLFLLCAVLSSGLLQCSILVYILYCSLLINTKKYKLVLICSLLLPFIDNSIFNVVFNSLIEKGSLNYRYISWGTAIIMAISVAKLIEPEIKKALIKANYKSLLLLLIPIPLILFDILINRRIIINLPVPLFAVVPLVVLESRYLSIAQNISLKKTLGKLSKTFSNISKSIFYLTRWSIVTLKMIDTRTIRSKTISIINFMDKLIKTNDYVIAIVISVITIIIMLVTYGGR